MSYTTLANFGGKKTKKMDVSDPENPLTYCLNDSLSVQFLHGPTSSKYKPRCKECQSYMRLRCAGKYDKKETWDKYCKFYYQANKHTYSTPTNPNANLATVNTNIPITLSFGEQLLHNAAEEKYIRYVDRKVTYEQFDPMVATSPYIEMSCNGLCAAGTGQYKVVINKNGLDKDPLMNELLDHPKAGYDILAKIFKAHNSKQINIAGTKLEKYLSSNKQMLNNVLKMMEDSNPYINRFGKELGEKMGKTLANAGCNCACDASEIEKTEQDNQKEMCKIMKDEGILGPCSYFKM